MRSVVVSTTGPIQTDRPCGQLVFSSFERHTNLSSVVVGLVAIVKSAVPVHNLILLLILSAGLIGQK